ncbi:MAG: antitermination protein NusG [Xanthomonadales bacterium]|nr:antitermination protein NusG [Xanthomonadales bacterium]NNL95336.1 antitermination protein NusG [Xanthomonadales bacterium]
MELSLFNEAGLHFLLRWIHLLAGVTWIGLLYYFNFVQGEYFKEADGAAKSDVIRKLVPNALWWFRWGAMFTFLSGAAMMAVLPNLGHISGLGISIGAVLGTLMFLNVWMIIWPNQKIVIASAQAVADGGDALPDAGSALAKAGLASRTNTLFSIPMLFFMAASNHLGGLQTVVHSAGVPALASIFGLIIALELNAIFGKTGPMTSVKGVIHMGFLLTAVLYLLAELL